MLTRSLERIFNPSRYNGKLIYQVFFYWNIRAYITWKQLWYFLPWIIYTTSAPKSNNPVVRSIHTASYTDKTSTPFPFILNTICSWWQFSFRFWTKWKSIRFKIERKLSPRAYPIQYERKWNTSFFSVGRAASISPWTGEVFWCAVDT